MAIRHSLQRPVLENVPIAIELPGPRGASGVSRRGGEQGKGTKRDRTNEEPGFHRVVGVDSVPCIRTCTVPKSGARLRGKCRNPVEIF